MARVHIEKDIYLFVDHMNVTLEKRTVVKTGEKAGQEIFSPIGHFATVKGAVNGLIRLKLAESSATTLSELLAELKRIESEVMNLIKY